MNANDIPMTAPNLAPLSPDAVRADLWDAIVFHLLNPEGVMVETLVGDDMLTKPQVIERAIEETALAHQAAERNGPQTFTLDRDLYLARTRAALAALETPDRTPARRNMDAIAIMQGQRDAELPPAPIAQADVAEDAQELVAMIAMVRSCREAVSYLTLAQCKAGKIDPNFLLQLDAFLEN